MAITVTLRHHEGVFQVFYQSLNFQEGLTVTGYLIYSDLTKSDVQTFEELGDGIYSMLFPYIQKSNKRVERYGFVGMENGVTKLFEIVNLRT